MSDYFSVELATAHTVILIYIPLCLIISSSKSGSTFLPPVFTFHYVWLLPLTAATYSRNNCMIYIPLCLIIPRNIHNLFLLIIFIYIPLCLIISYSDSPLTLSDTYLHSTMSDYFRNTIAYHRRDIFIYIPLCLIITICIVSGLISVYIFTFHYVWLFLTGFFAI